VSPGQSASRSCSAAGAAERRLVFSVLALEQNMATLLSSLVPMNQPSPCPQCHAERIWARAALGPYGVTHVAFCPGCARAATLCSRCGGELVLVRQSSWAWAGRPRVETTLHCPACRQAVPAAHPAPQPPALGVAAPAPAAPLARESAAPVSRDTVARFVADAPAPQVVQNVADDLEDRARTRYVRRRSLLGLVEEAARRADSLARLEASLARLRLSPEG